MKVLRNILCACALSLGLYAPVYAGTGSSCSDPIEMGTSYSAQVRNNQTVWYSANTMDLPLKVTFTPLNTTNIKAPEVEMDFTCTTGYYEDSILCRLFCVTSSSSILDMGLPYKPNLKVETIGGKTVYSLALGKAYRDLLLKNGIYYNLKVLVKVTYHCNGVISLSPDDLFSSCVDNAKFMRIGDTVNVTALNKQRHVVVPYLQWQSDTIRYKWTDAQQPCILAVANKCDFDPSATPDDDVIDYQTMQPGDSVTVSAALITQYVNNQVDFPNEAGMYFAKFYSAGPGVMKIVKAPQTPPRGNATILRFDRTYALNANESALYAIPTSWNDDTLNTKFVTPTDHVFSLTIATDPDFSTEHTLKTYQFEQSDEGHWQGIFGSEMTSFWNQTSEKYLYVRFDCSEATTVTPSKWEASACIKKTTYLEITPNTTLVVTRNNKTKIYRLSYKGLIGGDLTASFSKNDACRLFVESDCDISTSTQTAPPERLAYKNMQGRNTVTITADNIAAWKDKVVDQGYVYLLFYTTANGGGTVTLNSSAPEEGDPEYPSSTIAVACDNANQYYVEVTKAQTITIKNAEGTDVKTINAQPAVKYSLSDLSAGTYTLQGETETITLSL